MGDTSYHGIKLNPSGEYELNPLKAEELPDYTGEDCEKCGRNRVEPFENGDEICEKCHWNKTKQEYEHNPI